MIVRVPPPRKNFEKKFGFEKLTLNLHNLPIHDETQLLKPQSHTLNVRFIKNGTIDPMICLFKHL